MKDLGPLKYFLRIEVARNSSSLYLYQKKYTLEIAYETGLMGTKPISTPLETNHHLAKASGPLFAKPDLHQCLIGESIYLTLTCPGLAYIFHIIAQFMQQPKTTHWDTTLQVVRYLKGCPGQGILLHSDSPLLLTTCCDYNWAFCLIT